MMFNVINGALFMGSKVRAGVVFGGLNGMVGMAGVFWPELVTNTWAMGYGAAAM